MSPLFPPSGRIVCRFSCGAASAVATKLAIEKYGEVEIYYNDTGSEHPDNARFMADCERWLGQPINVLRSKEYANIYEVFETRRFLVSHAGAPCTSELKRIPGEAVWRLGDTEIFGYTKDEAHRLDRFRKDNPERIIECPLIDAGITKDECFDQIMAAGIELPAMYRLGFRNNNCIGCVKARDNLDYWKRVRKHFPAQFARTAALERELNVTINRVTRAGVRTPIYLDEIPDGDPSGPDPKISCGLVCASDEAVVAA
jgi:3'-phosphoadenosine 5'-phosphosulfate sulfotransferase (PAPS reductase)/FAD synthetase